jgi:hypothetical protein
MYLPLELSLLGSANGANTGTSAALDASISVDLVLAVLLSNSVNRAFAGTCAASDAIIGNLVSHDHNLHVNITMLL